MNSNVIKIELLHKDNYEIWKLHMEALLIKSDLWQYVSGELAKPQNTTEAPNADEKWIKCDRKAKADLILCISASELSQLKGCTTSRDVWIKLQSIYASKGPARKGTLLKQLALNKMSESEDCRAYLNKFFETVDKLEQMEIPIHKDLLSILLLYSLPDSFENFRCAIESRDELPEPENLKVKILEESEARIQKKSNSDTSNAMMASKDSKKSPRSDYNKQSYSDSSNQYQNQRENRFANKTCYRCQKKGHTATRCRSKYPVRRAENTNAATEQDDAYIAEIGDAECNQLQTTGRNVKNGNWILDSGCTAHLSKSRDDFIDLQKVNQNLNLANNVSTKIQGKGTLGLKVSTNSNNEKNIKLDDALLVPDLRANLLSVAKIVDKGNVVLFKRKIALIKDNNNKVKMVADRVGDLFYLREASTAAANCVPETKLSPLQMWHHRLGHLNEKSLRKLLKETNNITFSNKEELSNCQICTISKQTVKPFKGVHTP